MGSTPRLSSGDLQRLAEELQGTADSIETALERLDIDADDVSVDDIEDQLLEVSLERCQGCDWWHESNELAPDPETEDDDDSLYGYCADCRRDS